MRVILAACFLLLATAVHAQAVGGSSARIAGAVSNKNITTAVTAPNSTTNYLMMGLAGSITPAVSGNVFVIMSGTIYEPAGTGATIGINYQICYGLDTAPSNRGARIGTQAPIIATTENGTALTAAGDGFWPFSISAYIPNLIAGTAYWLDLCAKSVGTSADHSFNTVNISAVELAPQ